MTLRSRTAHTRRALLPFAVAACALAACEGNGDSSQGSLGALRLLSEPEMVRVRAFEITEVRFQLVNERGIPAPDREVGVTILDDPSTPEDEARGATLSSHRASTDSGGRMAVQLTAGLPSRFRLRASAARASDREVEVVVDEGTHGAVEVVPQGEALPGVSEVTTVRLHLFDNHSCAALSLRQLPPNERPPRTIPVDTSAVFVGIPLAGHHAVVGLGLDALGVARLAGCVDLPGSTLLLQHSVGLSLPLRPYGASPLGTYQATSTFPLAPLPMTRALLSDAWKDLSSCPLDPARLWLDCTIDATRTDEADPLDCRPMPGETPLGEQLEARRGRPVATSGGRCREMVDAMGRAGLDILAEAMFPSVRPALLQALPALAAEVPQLLEEVRLSSTLTVTPSAVRDGFLVDHRLRALEWPRAANAVTVDVRETGAPAPEARFVSATLRAQELDIASHGLTVRLGSAARLAFGRASLAPRGGPPQIGPFLAAIFAFARRTESSTVLSGCAALDSLLCADLGLPRGCLGNACLDGLAGLLRRLDAGFRALDGEDRDLFLAGSAFLVDRDGDHVPEGLGAPEPEGSPGVWTGELRVRGGPTPLTGTFTAQRVGP